MLTAVFDVFNLALTAVPYFRKFKRDERFFRDRLIFARSDFASSAAAAAETRRNSAAFCSAKRRKRKWRHFG
jgi:hypothetical protein